MIVVVGLGNPGKKFKNTRHNLGFMAVDFFAQNNDFPDFELSKKNEALVSQKEEVILAKPQTFMNSSGAAVKKIIASYKLQSSSLIVIHDDIDLPLGVLKIVKNRGSAGQKGVESIIENIGKKNLIRFRIGIQPERGKSKNPEEFVIKNFTGQERKTISKILNKISQAINYFAERGLEKTMNRFN